MPDEHAPNTHSWTLKTDSVHYESEVCNKCGLIRSVSGGGSIYLLPDNATCVYENDCNAQLIDSVLRE